ncbi:MAG: hydrogenase maturation peptidase HycI [Candidatus Saganbacteria bacterium]|nr:hydrogenase maturation peptidase HycI [Candidatus Saganbacteria bacterium]
MENFKQQLKTKLQKASKIGLLAVGSDLRADDVAGLLVAEALKKSIKNPRKFKTFFGATAPENVTGEIRVFNPSHLIIVDAAEIKGKVGTVKIIEEEEIGGTSFSTHTLPTKILVDYLRKSIGCEVIIIGIKPKSTKFGKPVSREIKDAVKRLAIAIKAALPVT